MNINITTIRPAGFIHSSGFAEVIDSLSWALSEIGHSVNVTENWLSGTETNIVFGAELLSAAQNLPKGTIIYNLEQPTHPNMDKIRALAKGFTVWDYSARNVETWKSLGYDVRHVPIGYTPNLTRIPKAQNQDIDCLFYGYLTPRRVKIIDDLKAAGLNVVATDRCYGGGRDNLISRAKVVLNVHHDGRDLFEIVRVSYLLANSTCVVSEISSDDGDYKNLNLAISKVPYDALVSEVLRILKFHPVSRDRLSSAAFNDFYKQAYVQSVRDAMGVETTWKMRVYLRYTQSLASGDIKDFLPWLRDHAKGKILEIGVRDGASTSAFLSGLAENDPKGHLYSVDIQPCGHLFAGHPQWTFVQASSRQLSLSSSEKFDIILIDGDHTPEGYKADLEMAGKMIKSGGMILSHDIDPKSGLTLEDMPGSDRPSKAIREQYFKFCSQNNFRHEELPGENGMGVIYWPEPSNIESDESWEGSAALCK